MDARRVAVVLQDAANLFYTPNGLVWLWVEFNAPLDVKLQYLTSIGHYSDAVFTANQLTGTDKQNSTGKYR